MSAVTSGCAPTCETICNKITRCELADGFEQLECQESCTRQDAQYKVEGEDTLKRAFADHRRCIASATCEEIEAGECYDEDLFLF